MIESVITCTTFSYGADEPIFFPYGNSPSTESSFQSRAPLGATSLFAGRENGALRYAGCFPKS